MTMTCPQAQTPLQSMYWQKVKLQDQRWIIDRKIAGVQKHNKQPRKLLVERSKIVMEIDALESKMQVIETRMFQ